MKKRKVLLSALVLCGCMLIGAGAADAASQTQLTRQAITHFQQSPPEEDISYPGYPTWKTWQIDSCEVFPCRLIEEKDIWELIFTPSDDRSRWDLCGRSVRRKDHHTAVQRQHVESCE